MENDEVAGVVERLGTVGGRNVDAGRGLRLDAEGAQDGAEVLHFVKVVTVQDGKVVTAAAVLAGRAEAGGEPSAGGKGVEGGEALPGGEIEQDVEALGAKGTQGGGRLGEVDENAATGAGNELGGSQILAHAEMNDFRFGKVLFEILKGGREEERIAERWRAKDAEPVNNGGKPPARTEPASGGKQVEQRNARVEIKNAVLAAASLHEVSVGPGRRLVCAVLVDDGFSGGQQDFAVA